jgi:hypothetical protein
MATPEMVLTALARMEERLVARIDESHRELRLEMNGGFDAINLRLDRLEQGTPVPVDRRTPVPGVRRPTQ